MTDNEILVRMIAQLNGLLVEERDSLIKGAFGRLEVINKERDNLLEQIKQFHEYAEITTFEDSGVLLEKVMVQNEENLRLVGAARRGAEWARKRISELHDERLSIGAYSITGARIEQVRALAQKERLV